MKNNIFKLSILFFILILSGCKNLTSSDIEQVHINMNGDKVSELLGKPTRHITNRDDILDEVNQAIKSNQYVSDRAKLNPVGTNKEAVEKFNLNLDGLKNFKQLSEQSEDTYIDMYTYKVNEQNKDLYLYFYKNKVIAIF